METAQPWLTEDILMIILLESKLEEIQSLCAIKKFTYLCNNQFWIEIFKRDDIPIFNKLTTIAEWIHEYKKLKNLQIKINAFLDKVDELGSIASFDSKNTNLKLYLPENFIKKHDKSFTKIAFFGSFYDDDNNLLYTLYYKDSSSNYNITITRDQLKTMLMNLLYHYPNTKLNNGINRS